VTYQAVPFGDFSGGLNLKDKADVVKDSEAIDLLNVEFTERGAVKQRDGFLQFTGTALTNRVDSLGVYLTAGGTRHLLAGCGTRLEAVDTSGSVVASATGLTGGPYVFARFAAPGSELAYAANGSDTIRQWNGTAWSAPTGTVNGTGASALPEAGAICVTPATNRLVATAYGTNTTGGPAAGASNPSRVHFSNAGQPTIWETDGASGRGENLIDLTPGDGEQIMNCVAWQNKVFVFKESKFFVFEGEAVDATGNPIFLYQAVDTGVGLAAKLGVCVGRDGVYFMSRQGVYVTNGGPPALLSEIVEPMWLGNPEVYFQSDTLNHGQIALARLTWHDERLYLALPTGSSSANDRVLVYDLSRRWWSLWDLPASAVISFRQGNQAELHFGYSSGAKEVGYVTAGQADDDGTAITSRWRSGWFDYSNPNVKTIRETKLWGSGSITARFSKDFERAATQTASLTLSANDDTWGDGTDPTDVWGDGTDSSETWGGAGQISATIARKAIRGTVFSTEFVAAGVPWSIHRVARHLREQRVPSVVGTER
jgi:hypothetical protein